MNAICSRFLDGEGVAFRFLCVTNQYLFIGDYRMGIAMDGETAVLSRFLPRGETYLYFP